MPHLVGIRAVATRRNLPVSAAVFIYASESRSLAETPQISGNPHHIRISGSLCSHHRVFFCIRDGTVCVQALDVGRAESELSKNLFIMFSQCRGAPCRHFADAMHLNGTADCRGQRVARPLERHDDVIESQLRIVDHLLWCTHGTERDVDALKISYQCAIGCEPKTSSRIAVSCGMFCTSFAGSVKRGSFSRSSRPMAFATACNLSGVTMRTNQVSSAVRYTFIAAFAGFFRSCNP